MKVKRDDYRQVTPTAEEVAEFRSRARTRQGRKPPTRAEHLPCGTRLWYVGITIAVHGKACTGRREQ